MLRELTTNPMQRAERRFCFELLGAHSLKLSGGAPGEDDGASSATRSRTMLSAPSLRDLHQWLEVGD